ncbi:MULTISPECIES: 5-(carboxyamino)imidazole ribonucleotide synthase [unclassified Haladaptatus]|uniref:5-(carboxyamino)imidazole ribonucleotide synthase n=1 Tax=unclassified Haladaptatus TaxID=2622732 RepID=UPI00209C0CD7|nr:MULTISPECIES: 5-(carboxyamino)imidazole ribonucleotide synthase [unclassified Haladaptatus]MCO8246129.1 5-(carboxyamino)imidazole ribonucleotide synthase [Haladaptatus sp. AB643]MCO8254251.1 5-(carboxyamino)imidazole ribonucleotide synthase [Haladaptatus sp. AB618]
MVTASPLTLGVVGGGQLGRMLAEAASPLGVELIVLDPTPDCPASLVARDQIVGDFDDEDAIRELAERSDALTFEIELADPDVLEAVSDEFDVPVHPDPATLRTIQDKLVQKRALQDRGIPVPDFRQVDSREDLLEAGEEFGYPMMLKARRGGYDGRGNVPVEDEDDVDNAMSQVSGELMVEEFVPFERELSVIAVKGDDGVATFPVGENVHEDEILRQTVVPARTSDEVRERAEEVAREVLSALSGRGTYGIELFEREDGKISVNEIAPRPHNSGHYTIEGALTSQFEQHARGVLGYPLGATTLRGSIVMSNILGDVDEPEPADLSGVEGVLSTPGASFHWYGKHDVRPLRKMGHVTLVGDDDPATVDEPTLTDLHGDAKDLTDSLTFQ